MLAHPPTTHLLLPCCDFIRLPTHRPTRLPSGVSLDLAINTTWDGRPLSAAEWPSAPVRWHLRATREGLAVTVSAPFHGDPPPPSPPGRCDGLWNYEVVELFLLGPCQHYFELEVGPHGHFLALALAGVRKRQADDFELGAWDCRRLSNHWSANLVLPWPWLPQPIVALNAYAIAGQGSDRRYFAHAPSRGLQPDFHRLDEFRRLTTDEQSALQWRS